MAPKTNELSRRANRCSLSPGERAGVRASVKLTSLFSPDIRRFHRPGVIRQLVWRAGLQLAEDSIQDSLFVLAQSRVPETKFLDAH